MIQLDKLTRIKTTIRQIQPDTHTPSYTIIQTYANLPKSHSNPTPSNIHTTVTPRYTYQKDRHFIYSLPSGHLANITHIIMKSTWASCNKVFAERQSFNYKIVRRVGTALWHRKRLELLKMISGNINGLCCQKMSLNSACRSMGRGGIELTPDRISKDDINANPGHNHPGQSSNYRTAEKMLKIALYALRILGVHQLPSEALKEIARATSVAMLLCASQAWWGFTLVEDRVRNGSDCWTGCGDSGSFRRRPWNGEVSSWTDDGMLRAVMQNDNHVLKSLFPTSLQNPLQRLHPIDTIHSCYLSVRDVTNFIPRVPFACDHWQEFGYLF